MKFSKLLDEYQLPEWRGPRPRPSAVSSTKPKGKVFLTAEDLHTLLLSQEARPQVCGTCIDGRSPGNLGFPPACQILSCFSAVTQHSPPPFCPCTALQCLSSSQPPSEPGASKTSLRGDATMRCGSCPGLGLGGEFDDVECLHGRCEADGGMVSGEQSES